MSEQITSMCWCETDEVLVPVEWVFEGRTSPCGRPGCEPGCEPADHDEDEPVPVAKVKMSRFRPDEYDPASDSTPGLSHVDHPSLVLAHAPGLCWCGCAEPVVRGKARFLMGHDMRLLGKLTRAHTVEARVVLVDPDDGVRTGQDVLSFADCLSTPKKDWRAEVQQRADAIVRRCAGPSTAPVETGTPSAKGRGRLVA